MTTPVESAAADYTYHLPDHWVGHALKPDDPFVKMHRYYIGRVVQILLDADANTVLEAGCGDAWSAGQMVDAGLEVVGVDWSANAIGYARILVPGAQFHHGDVLDSEFAERFPDKFDAVAMIEVIEHIAPDACVAALTNITSRLRDGGTLVMTTPHVNQPNDNPQHFRHFTPELLTEVVQSVPSLEVVGIEGYGDRRADRTYYRSKRLVDNRVFTIKPLARRLARRLTFAPTPFDRCNGLILTAIKRS